MTVSRTANHAGRSRAEGRMAVGGDCVSPAATFCVQHRHRVVAGVCSVEQSLAYGPNWNES